MGFQVTHLCTTFGGALLLAAGVWTEGDSGEFFQILPKFDLFAKKKSIMNKYI